MHGIQMENHEKMHGIQMEIGKNACYLKIGKNARYSDIFFILLFIVHLASRAPTIFGDTSTYDL